MLNLLVKLIVGATLILLWLWCSVAIYFMGLPGEKLPVIATSLFAFNLPLLVIFMPNRKYGFFVAFGLCIMVLLYWTRIKPSHDRNWMPSVARLPTASIEDNRVHIVNIRNFDYRTENDFTIRYYDKTYDLNTLKSVDYILSYWDGNKAIAHTLLSFGFAKGDHLVVSVETRLEKNEVQSGLGGLFKQYELIYVLADENDILRLRTNFRKEAVYLYPTTLDKTTIQKLFIIVINSVNKIKEQPEFYNTITENCLTSLTSKFRKEINPDAGFDYRRLVNGFSDEMLFDNGKIASTLDFKATKRRCYINQYVSGIAAVTDYSRKIRPYLDSKK